MMSRGDHVPIGVPVALADADLHALIIARDEQAFAEWERRTAKDVLRMVRGRGLSNEDAEEVWNETLLVIWRRAVAEPALEPMGEGLRRYAFGVASRLTAGRARERARHVQTVVLDERDQETQSGVWVPRRAPSNMVYALRRCMEMIDDRWRVILEMVQIGTAGETIAEVVGISTSSVRKYIQRAKAAARKCVEQETDV